MTLVSTCMCTCLLFQDFLSAGQWRSWCCLEQYPLADLIPLNLTHSSIACINQSVLHTKVTKPANSALNIPVLIYVRGKVRVCILNCKSAIHCDLIIHTDSSPIHLYMKAHTPQTQIHWCTDTHTRGQPKGHTGRERHTLAAAYRAGPTMCDMDTSHKCTLLHPFNLHTDVAKGAVQPSPGLYNYSQICNVIKRQPKTSWISLFTSNHAYRWNEVPNVIAV